MGKLTRRTLMGTLPFVIPIIGSSFRSILAMSLAGRSGKSGFDIPQPVTRQIKYAHTSCGEIAYTEHGTGQPALFVHAAFLNGYQWRDVIARLADMRRIIAVDLMAHGATKIKPDQPVSYAAQADMLEAFCEDLKLEQVDLVANDSGGGISQIFAAKHPERIRTLTLGNCDTHDNWPGPVVQQLMKISDDQLAGLIHKWLKDVNTARTAFQAVYEHADRISDETFRTYFEPLVQTPEAIDNFHRFFLEQDHSQTLEIEPLLKRLEAPTLVVWGTDDQVFGVKWATWLSDTIPGTRKLVLLKGARPFFPEEHAEELANLIRDHWSETSGQKETH